MCHLLWMFVLHRHMRFCDTFSVVRHPFSRMLSQYLYAATSDQWNAYAAKGEMQGPLQGKLCEASSFEAHVKTLLQELKKEELAHDCHHANQVLYTSEEHFRKNVLHVEHLEEEFNELMANYGLPLKLHSVRNNRK